MDIHGSGLLQVAVYLGEVEVCKYFVEELGFDVNAGGLCGGVYFSYAILTPFFGSSFASMDCAMQAI
jgi:hypothetical protein